MYIVHTSDAVLNGIRQLIGSDRKFVHRKRGSNN